MNSNEISRLHELEKYYWWHVGRKRILETFLKRISLPKDSKILDVGCGTGETTKIFEDYGKVWGVDVSDKALEFCRKQGLQNLRQSGARHLPFEDRFFDVVAMLDILEHIEEDEEALREVYRVLKGHGYLLITVPAWQFLWSDHDEALEHKRRYIHFELRSKLEKADFKIQRLSYAIMFLSFPIVFWRLFQKIFVQSSYPKTSYVVLPPWLNTFFIFLLRLEARLLKYINLPFGISLVCLVRKK
ncbi:MAG: class I SAM-dependent methyltransferase [Patescibacteria group bacterium]|nr:class I SAM-dependent methyltransferase [Patescibacteria group bacterium]